MASEKISQLAPITAVASGDFFPIVTVSGALNKRVDIGVLDGRYASASVSGSVETLEGQVLVLQTDVTGLETEVASISGVVASGDIAYLNLTQSFSSPQTFDAGASDAAGSLRSIPVNNNTNVYTLQATDAGKVIVQSSSNVITVPSDVFSDGDAISVYYQQSVGTLDIVQGAGVSIVTAGDGAVGNKSIEPYGLVTILCINAASNDFIISGVGIA